MRADLMALELLTTTAFEKDMRRARKQGTGGGPIAGALQPASVTRGLDGTLGLPRGTGLATTLQADRETTGACSHRQPYRIVRMNGRSPRVRRRLARDWETLSRRRRSSSGSFRSWATISQRLTYGRMF